MCPNINVQCKFAGQSHLNSDQHHLIVRCFVLKDKRSQQVLPLPIDDVWFHCIQKLVVTQE